MKGTKKKIVDAMYELIAAEGYDKASIGKISDMIDIKKPSVYYHFKNKEEILIEMIDEFSRDFTDDFRAIFETKNKNEYIYALHDYGHQVIMKTDVDFVRVYSEIHKLSTRIVSVKSRVIKMESEYENAIRATFWQGVNIGAFSENFDLESGIQLFIIIMEGINNVISYDMPVDVLAAWTGFVDMMTKN